MRHIFITTLLLLTAIVSYAQNGTVSSTQNNSDLQLPSEIVVTEEPGGGVAMMPQNATPRYILGACDSFSYRLLFDTATGRLWLVNIRNDKAESTKHAINGRALLAPGEDPCIGRFELIATDSIYTFIVLDNETGRLFRAVWNSTPGKCSFIELL